LTDIKAAATAMPDKHRRWQRARFSESCAQFAGFCEQALTVGLAMIRNKAEWR
jgi:hypothetical protein